MESGFYYVQLLTGCIVSYCIEITITSVCLRIQLLHYVWWIWVYQTLNGPYILYTLSQFLVLRFLLLQF